MSSLLDRKLLFVTGKGGVGKTTVAAALGALAAGHGKRTLVCEVDAKGNLADFFEAGRTGFDPTEVSPNVFAMSMNTEESLKEYLSLQLKLPVLARIGPLARTFDFVANAAPGVKEILTVGKLAWEVRERHYDLVVVDASASGHIVGQLAAPEAIKELVQVGLVRDQTGWMLDILGDASVYRIPKPSMGSEDFSHYLQQVPGAMFRLGTAAPERDVHLLHSARFDIDERAIGHGAKILARSAFELMHLLAQDRDALAG